MSNTANNILPTSVPKLDVSGANWAIFALCFQTVIQGKGLWRHFDGSSPCLVLSSPVQPSPVAVLASATPATPTCYAPSSISVLLHSCRGQHTCCPHVMLLFLVPVPGTFLLLSSFGILLAIVPCNEVTPHCTPHGGPSPFLLVATPIPIPQLVYKLQ